MSVNIGKIAAVVGKAAKFVPVDKVDLLLSQTVFLIELAEDAIDGIKGSEKLQAVRRGLEDFVEDEMPDVAARFNDLWRLMKPVISLVVTLYHAAGVFKKAVA